MSFNAETSATALWILGKSLLITTTRFMLFDGMKNARTHTDKDPTNDNEELSFVKLAALTANVARFLQPHKKEQEQAEREAQHRQENDQKANDAREYIERRVRELREFEARARNVGTPRRFPTKRP